MRIAQVLGFAGVGGIIRMAATLSKALSERGHESELIYWDGAAPGFPATARSFKKIDIFGLSRHSLASNLTRKLGKICFGRHLAPRVFSSFLSPQMDRFLRRNHYDIAVFHDFHYFGFHRLKHPHVFASHGNQRDSLNNNKTKSARRLLRGVYAKIFDGKHIAAVSQGSARENTEHFNAAPKEIRCIHNPFDFDDIRTQAEGPAPHPRPYIMSAGRLVRSKRYDLLLQAYAEAKISEDLLLLGDGRENEGASYFGQVKAR